MGWFGAMGTRRELLAGLAGAAAFPAAAAEYGPGVPGVLERARQAAGGPVWNKLAGLHETGVEDGQRYERWIDLLRFGLRTETDTPGGGRLVRGFNGYGAWSLLPQGFDRAKAPAPTMAEALSEAYFAGYGYFFPSRFDVRAAHLGVRPAAGRSFDVVRIHPNGGEPREVWFDRKTGLPGRMVEVRGPRPFTVEMSDYKRAGSVLIPHRYLTTGGGLAKPLERTVQAADVRRVEREMFSLPRQE